MLRSIAAVVAGFLVTGLLVSLSDALIMVVAPQLFPPPPAAPPLASMLISITYGTLYAILGGYVMAVIARQQLMKHLYWLIGLLIVFGILSAFAYAVVLPWWYNVAVVVMGIVGYYIGVQLYAKRHGEATLETSAVDTASQ
jgi:hypothetical protein